MAARAMLREYCRICSRIAGSSRGKSAGYSSQLYSSASVMTENDSRDANGAVRQQEVPLVPKRDPGAVLKALASTVDELPHPLILGRSPSDPLAPRDRREQMEFIMAMEAGSKAADYFIRRWPEMFRGRQTEPDMFPEDHMSEQLTKVPSEEGLTLLIAQKKTRKALKMYKMLRKKGVSLSLGRQNGLLRLLAWDGVGNTSSARQHKKQEKQGNEEEAGLRGVDQEDSEEGANSSGTGVVDLEPTNEDEVRAGKDGETSSSLHHPSLLDSEKSIDGERNVRDSVESTWSMKNKAERLFRQMVEKNGETYDAMICGLVKYKAYKRAFQLFDDLLTEGHQANQSMYNALLKALVQTKPTHAWRRAKDILSHMESAPVVLPNTTTFNHLLDLAKGTGTSQRQLSYEVMQEMEYLGIKPTLTTFLKLLECHVFNMDVSVLYDIVDYLEQHSEAVELKEPHDIYFFPAAMSASRYAQDVTLAERIKRLAQKDNWLLVQNVEYFLSHFLAVLSSKGGIHTAHKEYKSLVPAVFVPRDWVYVGLLDCCARCKEPDHAVAVMEDVNKFRVKRTNARVFERFFNALLVPLNPERLSEYYKAAVHEWGNMRALDIRPNAFIIGQMVRLSCLVKDVHAAREYHAFFKQYGMKPPFIALSSLLRLHVEMENIEMFKETLGELLEHKYRLATSFVKSNYLSRLPLTPEERSEIVASLQDRMEEPAQEDQEAKEAVSDKKSIDSVLGLL